MPIDLAAKDVYFPRTVCSLSPHCACGLENITEIRIPKYYGLVLIEALQWQFWSQNHPVSTLNPVLFQAHPSAAWDWWFAIDHNQLI